MRPAFPRFVAPSVVAPCVVALRGVALRGVALCAGALLAAPPARAADVQVAVFPPAMGLANGLVAGQVFRLREDRLGAAVSCWDEVGVRNLNLVVPLEGVTIVPQAGYATVTVDFGTISAENWTIFADDSERDDDLCDPFSGELQWLALTDGSLTLDTQLAVDDRRLELTVLGDPVLGGDLGMDIEWAPDWADGWGWDLWPDDLLLDLFEEDLLGLAAQGIANMASGMVSELLGELTFGGEVGQLDVEVSLASLAVSPEGIGLRAEPTLSWAAKGACVPAPQDPPGGTEATVTLRRAGSAAGVAVDERLLNDLAWALWSDGFFCMQAEGVERWLDVLLPELGATPTSGQFALRDPPRFGLGTDGLSLSLTGLQLRLDSWDDGPTTILDTTLDLDARVLVGVDPTLNMLVVQDASLAIDLVELRTQHLLTDAEGAEEDFEAFVETWAPRLAGEALVGAQLFPAVLQVAGFTARLDEIVPSTGALSAYVSAWAAGDAAVDVVPPETTATLLETSLTTATLAVAATDDRADPLAWKWRFRGEEAWSPWTTSATVEVPLPVNGKAEVQVVARDAWFNEDDSPAAVRLVPALSSGVTTCATVPPASAGLAALLVAGLLAARRGRPAPVGGPVAGRGATRGASVAVGRRSAAPAPPGDR